MKYEQVVAGKPLMYGQYISMPMNEDEKQYAKIPDIQEVPKVHKISLFYSNMRYVYLLNMLEPTLHENMSTKDYL